VARPIGPHQQRLAERLEQIRSDADISGSELARRLGWPQSRVSRLLNAIYVASREDVVQIAEELRLGKAVRLELVDLVRLAASEAKTWRDEFYARGGGGQVQKMLADLDRNTTVTRQLVLGIIPGLLQTPAYARDVIRAPGGPRNWGADDDASLDWIVEQRLKRQSVLRDAGREFHFVFAEAVLWTRYGTAETLVEQLYHLVETMHELPAVDIRVVPFTAVWPIFPMATFKLRDKDVVSLEQQVGSQDVVDSRQVEDYVRQFELLDEAALGRDASMDLIRDVASRIP
jgi:transcriptional regulator with XRE-family HTH domain